MKTIYFFLAAAILCPIFTFCQLQGQQRIDSLLTKYESLEDGIPKIKVLEELYYAEVYNNPEKGLEHAKNALDQAKKIEYWSGIGVGYYHIGVYHKLTGQLDSAKHYYHKSLKVWEKHPNIKNHATALSSIARIEFDKGFIDKAIELEKEVTEIYRENGFWLNYGNGLMSVGGMYQNKGSYKIAMDYTLRSLKVLDTVPEEPWRDADALVQLGNIEYVRGNFQESLGHYEKALKVYTETNDNIYKGHTLVDMGTALFEMKKYDEAIATYNQALEISREIKVNDMEGNCLSNLGMVYIRKGDYDIAIDYLQKALKINRTKNTHQNLINNLGELGHALSLKGNVDEAIPYLNDAVTMSDSIGALDFKKLALIYRSKAFKNSQQFEKAFADIEKSQEINDSLFNKSKSQQIEELKTIYETEKKEAALALQEEEINTLNEKAKVDKLTKGLYAGGMASALALFGLSVFGYRQRIKRNRIAREKQEEIYKQEIAHKKKELASQTLHLVQKNTFIQELKENLENLKNSPEKFKVEFRRIVMLLKKQNASDKDWEVFKTYFSEVHNDFDQKLKTLYPDISEKEIRLAAFLRMNLTTKEIAATLNVLPDSILKSKYRLKKKLGLDKETDLTTFLNTL
ncbi:tetratricopeptide repeat protein [Flagellimonas nanhaiensis]|uniref:Tetratricopeptide repeat protein n=1 Tax=Flagellimonas nanhaiensis TaxID=2292706 RepID=A0A371JUL1_9FLAO|nr:tetratricopeptide repeat protein [Allomuricauda nanhaiensis]RDY61495.1 tetratricopeptide repeat protein [Allomuricauda nanhaiensis]